MGKYVEKSGATATPSELGTGTPDSSTFLRGDSTWATPSGGGGGTTATRVVVNASFPAQRNKKVNVVDAVVTTANRINAWVSGLSDAASDGDLIDLYAIRAYAKTGSFDLCMDFLTPWAGSLSIDYVVFS